MCTAWDDELKLQPLLAKRSVMPQHPKIVVIGSLNVDHTLRVPHIPAPGETLTATAAFTCLGGKGANQALAAARAGGDVTLIG